MAFYSWKYNSNFKILKRNFPVLFLCWLTLYVLSVYIVIVKKCFVLFCIYDVFVSSTEFQYKCNLRRATCNNYIIASNNLSKFRLFKYFVKRHIQNLNQRAILRIKIMKKLKITAQILFYLIEGIDSTCNYVSYPRAQNSWLSCITSKHFFDVQELRASQFIFSKNNRSMIIEEYIILIFWPVTSLSFFMV